VQIDCRVDSAEGLLRQPNIAQIVFDQENIEVLIFISTNVHFALGDCLKKPRDFDVGNI
jgi:hypothetical protein